MTRSASFATVHVRDVPGMSIAYERRGAGEPLVLLHGIGHHRQAWDPVFDRLAAERDVVAVDLPGFGESPEAPEGVAYELDSYAHGLDSLFRRLGITRPHVAGNSMGGLVALRLGQLGFARSVTALAPAGIWSGWERFWALSVLSGMRVGARRLPPGLVERLSRSAAGRAALTGMIYHRPGRRDPAAVVAEAAAMRAAPAFERILALARRSKSLFEGDVPGIPVTLAWGNRDRVLIGRQSVRLHQAIPAARLVRLHGCGHVPMNDAPELVARLIIEGSSPRRV